MFGAKVTENKRQAYFIKFLNSRGYICWRNNTIKAKLESGNWISNGKAGSPDIVGYTPQGYFFGIETKVPKAKLNDNQKAFAKQLRETQFGIYIVSREIEDIMEKLMGIKQEQIF